jgi:PAS domain S-box-containing protein
LEHKSQNTSQLENASRLKAIIDTAIDGIITIDQRGIVESLNPAAAKIFGYKPEEVIGENIKILMPEPDRGLHDGYMENYHRTGVKKIIGIGREVLGRKKDGTTFPFLLSVSEVALENAIAEVERSGAFQFIPATVTPEIARMCRTRLSTPTAELNVPDW